MTFTQLSMDGSTHLPLRPANNVIKSCGFVQGAPQLMVWKSPENTKLAHRRRRCFSIECQSSRENPWEIPLAGADELRQGQFYIEVVP
jgi:hypothetical protein